MVDLGKVQLHIQRGRIVAAEIANLNQFLMLELDSQEGAWLVDKERVAIHPSCSILKRSH